MRAVLQRVSTATVSVAGDVVGTLNGPGVVVLLGVTHDDTRAEAAWLAHKVHDLRLFDGAGGPERSLGEVGGGALVISQFTLYGDARKGRRPSWQAAAPAPVAEPLYDAFCEELRALSVVVEQGIFGAHMQVALVNDGPVTLVLETPDARR